MLILFLLVAKAPFLVNIEVSFYFRFYLSINKDIFSFKNASSTVDKQNNGFSPISLVPFHSKLIQKNVICECA